MSVLEAQAVAAFHTAADGTRVFYPWGVFGRGRVIADDADYALLKTTLKRTWRVGLCLTVVVGPLTDWVTALLSMVVLLGVHAWRLARCVRPLPVARRRMTMAYQRDALARAYGTGGLLALAVGSFAVASAGAVVLVSAPDQWLAASTLVASGLAAGAVLASMWPSRGATA